MQPVQFVNCPSNTFKADLRLQMPIATIHDLENELRADPHGLKYIRSSSTNHCDLEAQSDILRLQSVAA